MKNRGIFFVLFVFFILFLVFFVCSSKFLSVKGEYIQGNLIKLDYNHYSQVSISTDRFFKTHKIFNSYTGRKTSTINSNDSETPISPSKLKVKLVRGKYASLVSIK